MRDDEETAAAHIHISQSQKVVPLQWYNFEIITHRAQHYRKMFNLGTGTFTVITHFRPILLVEFLSLGVWLISKCVSALRFGRRNA